MFFWKYILDGIVEKVSFSFIAGEEIAIARVYTGNSGVLVLDEPSSALDPISEEKMLQSQELMKN